MKKTNQHIRMLAKSIRELKRISPGYLALSISSSVFSAIYPYIPIYMSAKIIDALIAKNEIKTIFANVIITISLTFIFGIVSQILNKSLQLKGSILKNHHDLFLNEKMNSLALSQAEDARVQAMKERISSNANMFSFGIVRVAGDLAYFANCLISVCIAAALSCSLFFTEQPGGSIAERFGLSGLLLAAIALSVFVNYKSSVKKMKQISKSTSTLGNVSSYMAFYEKQYLEDYDAAKDIRIFGHKSFILREIGKNSADKLLEMRKITWRAQVNANMASAAVNSLTGGLLYVFAASKAYMGLISSGSIVLYFGAINRFISAVAGTASAAFRIRENTEYLKLFFDFLELKPAVQCGNRKAEKRKNHTLEFNNVSFRYPNAANNAVSNLTVSIPWGKKIAVVGENGSGKTTFIKLLCSFYKPDKGSISLDGYDIFDYDFSEYMSLFSVVFQDFKLLAQPICKNVSADDTYDEKRVYAALKKAGAASYIYSLKNKSRQFLYGDFDIDGVNVSGGEEQKIAIARAVYKDAPYMILDEPTAALDPIAEFEIYQNISNIIKDKTVILISHRLSSCRLCDKIAVFDKGSLVQFGSHDELLADENGKYYRLWKAQSQYYNI
ncbi:MAG: ABC transporter ATP-binding protein [Oscillospiraceae bacterium]|nr:ABC transporter ATP-binding protein [Oscillospiraceae bacterium]